MAAFLLFVAALVASVAAQPSGPPGPPGTFEGPQPIPISQLNTTGPFARCAGDITQNCQPITGADIPVTYLIQTSTNIPEQVQVVPSDPTGQHYTIAFIVPHYRSVKGQVEYSTDPALKAGVTTKTCTRSRYSIYPDTVGYYESGAIFRCLIGPLPYGTTFYYNITLPSSPNTLFSFNTLPKPALHQTIKLSLIADVGQTTNASSTLDNVILGSPDLVLFAGDLTYADNYGPDNDVPCVKFNGTNVGQSGANVKYAEAVTCGEGGLRWDSYFRLAQKLNAYFPVTYVAGNHELEQEYPFNSYTPYIAYKARIPGHISVSGTYGTSSLPSAPEYYSLLAGPVHIVGLASVSAFGPYSLQLNFIEDEFGGNVNKSVTPWLVVFLHVPWYNTDKSHYLEGEGMRAQTEKYLYNAGTDLVQAGHVHAYERSHPVYNYQLDPCGPVHVTVGDGGNDEGVAGPFLTDLSGKPLYYSAARDYYFGHAEVEFLNPRKAIYTWYRNVQSPPTIGDQFTLFSKLTSGCSSS